jgi:hypothetical protein
MFAVFLPSLNFRGNHSPYLWWFYIFLSAFREQAVYICGNEYFVDPKIHLGNGRIEASVELAKRYHYQIPDCSLLEALPRSDIDAHVWQSMEMLFPANPMEAFKHFCLNQDALLYKAFFPAFEQIEAAHGGIEAVITCVNCATLQNYCSERDLPLLHIELGPLRSPEYLQTAYFDFCGVNGRTESRNRFNASVESVNSPSEWQAIDALRSLFMTGKHSLSVQPTVDLGIGLQVEDDSNIICYANGFSSMSLVNGCKRLLAEGRVHGPILVRGHPGSIFSVNNLPPGLSIDRSETPMEFIRNCREIYTINSSLGLESLLHERNATVFGDSPFAYCIDAETHQGDPSALSFFLLNYLVPWRLAMSVDYIRWRLRKPGEHAIRDVHVEFYMREKISLLEARIADLEQELSARDQQIAVLRSSIFWQLSYPFRKLFRIVLERLQKTKK